jgi:aminopeptidase N
MQNRKLHIAYLFILGVIHLQTFSQISFFSGRKNKDIPIITAAAPGYSMHEEKYDVGFYFIDLEVTNKSTFIRGSITILAERVVPSIDTFVVELSQKLFVDSVFLQDKKYSHFIQAENLLKIPLENEEMSVSNYKLKVFYQGIAGSGGFYSGISNMTAIPWKQNITYTLSEPFQARDWFPVKQNLNDKADSSWVFVTVDSTLKVGSNGLLGNIKTLNGGRVRYEWKSNYPIAYYLLSFSAGNYIDYSFYAHINESDSVLVQNYLYNSPGIDSVKYVIDQTPALLKLFSDDFGTYPFIKEKYGHCMAPMGGGMEHQTMTTITGFNFGIVAHELAHSWFGDYLTCGTWQDIWINEGFASYSEYIALDALKSKGDALNWLAQAQNFAINFPDDGVFLSPEESRSVQRIFNYSLTYKKGGAIIHMLRYEINNDSLFFAIIRDYLSDFGNSTATGKDFMQIVENHTGENFEWFFNQWYYGKGFPYFVTSWRQAGDTLILYSSQRSSANDNSFFRTHMDFRIHFQDGSIEDFSVLYEKSEEIFRHKASKEISIVQIDPNSNVLKNNMLYKIDDLTKVFSASPNPFKNNLNIVFRSDTKKHDITITSITGNIVYSQSSVTGEVTLDMSFLRPGIYLLQVSEDGNKYSEKLIRQ